MDIACWRRKVGLSHIGQCKNIIQNWVSMKMHRFWHSHIIIILKNQIKLLECYHFNKLVGNMETYFHIKVSSCRMFILNTFNKLHIEKNLTFWKHPPCHIMPLVTTVSCRSHRVSLWSHDILVSWAGGVGVPELASQMGKLRPRAREARIRWCVFQMSLFPPQLKENTFQILLWWCIFLWTTHRNFTSIKDP